MRDSDKFLSDLDAWERRHRGDISGRAALSDMSHLLSRLLTGLPAPLLSDLVQGFAARAQDQGGFSAASVWLGAVAALLSGEGGGEGLSREDWADLGQTVSANAELLDVDRLSDIMGLVLEHGGL